MPASTISPMNIAIARAPINASVVAALRDFGLRNAGTPLLMASTPVSAALPEENARRIRKAKATPAIWVSCTRWKSALSARIS